MKRLQGFTLIEVLIVIVIMAIILSMTVFGGSGYLKSLQTRREKEAVINTINYALSYVKSTNYYSGSKFPSMDVTLGASGIQVILGTGSVFDTMSLRHTSLVVSGGGTSDLIRIFPYQRSCVDVHGGLSKVAFQIQSTINSDLFCFSRDMQLCKLFVASCP